MAISIFLLISVTYGCSPKKETMKNEAIRFMETLVKQGPSAAANMMDYRTGPEMRDLIKSSIFSGFDGEIEAAGDNTITMTATGVQYHTYAFRVHPVMKTGGEYTRMNILVDVTKDAGKVISAMPY